MTTYPYDINERCLIVRLTEELASLPFTCGDTEGDRDLEDFFHNQALLYAKEKLALVNRFLITSRPGLLKKTTRLDAVFW